LLLNKPGNQDGIVRIWPETFAPAGHPRISWTLVGFCVGLFIAQPAHATLDALQVAILINKDEGISSQVARMYQKLRAVPDGNLLHLSLGTNRQITGEQYWKLAADPIRKYPEAHPDVRCILTTSGDPYTGRLSGSDDSIVAFDSELAAVLRFDSINQRTDGNAQTREILPGTNLKNVAVADDGSVFGGVDDQKRLWVQRGVDTTPKVVEGVRRLLWGPVSHVALVQPETGDSRVYDSPLESWRDLGVITEAQWNSDESRLLFVQARRPGQLGTLSMLADRQVEPLYRLDRDRSSPRNGFRWTGSRLPLSRFRFG